MRWRNSWPTDVEERHITVPRTARYHVLGDPSTAQELRLVLHGYGQLARYFLRHFEGLGNGRLIVAPEGLSRYYTDAGHTRVGATWMTREDRGNEITDHVNYLDRLCAELIRIAGRSLPVHVLGFSQGVATAARWTTLGHTTPASLVLWGGQLPPDLPSGVLGERWASTPVTLVHGAQDELVPKAVMATAHQRLLSEGVACKLVEHPGGHALDRTLLHQLWAG